MSSLPRVAYFCMEYGLDSPFNARIEVMIRGKRVPLHAWKVERYLSSDLYLLEPERQEDHWITQRLYGGGAEDRIAQEIVLGVGGVRLLRALDLPSDVFAHRTKIHLSPDRLLAGFARRAAAYKRADESYDMRLGALLTRGTDIRLNNPRRPLEASGTSGMKAAMNGVRSARRRAQ